MATQQKFGKRIFRQLRSKHERDNRFALLDTKKIRPGKEVEAHKLEAFLNQEYRMLLSKGYSRAHARELAIKMNFALIRRVVVW